MSDNDCSINYKATPTARLFHNDDSKVRGLMGPVGSGKSVACAMEVFMRAMRIPPNRRGIRQSRWAIVRNTYPELQTTTIKTWKEWFKPGGICKIWEGSKPIRCMIELPLPDQTRVELEVLFMPLDKQDDVKKLLSLELTGAWINEAREVPKVILDGLSMRIPRYPSMKNYEGGVMPPDFWSGIIMDTNPPSNKHWWYRFAEEDTPEGYRFFKQPGALIKRFGENRKPYYEENPAAENINNLINGYQYYYDMLPGKPSEWIKAYVLAEYSSILAGKRVYPEYMDDVHCVNVPREDMLYNRLPLRLGWDFGLTPAVVIGQVTPTGAIWIIDELVAEGMGITQFANSVVKPHLQNHYPGMAIISHGDPAGVQRAQTDERTCVEALAEAGIPTLAAKTNKFTARREAVAKPMLRMIDGKAGLLINGRYCKEIHAGFTGGYHYAKLKIAEGDRYKEAPEKNEYSHPHDALQYLCLGVDDTLPVHKSVKSAPRKLVQTDFLF